MNVNNIYHCCLHKTGSQWVKAIFSDDIVFEKTGMRIYTYQKLLKTKGDPRKLNERMFDKPFPDNCIASPLYMDYNSYSSIIKPKYYKTFCIIRDPRDIIISWYFSVKYSHPLMGKIPQHREILKDITIKDGLIYCMKYLADYGLFITLKSWIENVKHDDHLMVIRFENIVNINKQLSIFMDLFSHCRVQITEKEVITLLEKYRFTSLKKKNNKTDVSHYRKGIPGEWKSYFDEELNALFSSLSKDIIIQLGYNN